MPSSHPPYPDEFKRRMVELVRAGRSPQHLANEFEPSTQAFRNWVKQAHLDSGLTDDGLTSDERDQLLRLRRENRRLAEGYNEGDTIAVALMADINVNGDSWRSSAIVGARNTLLG